MDILEGLACVEYGEILGNYSTSLKYKEFILESNPGMSYYGRFSFPLTSVEHDLYLIVKPFKHCHQDTILRIQQTVKDCMQEQFSAFPGQIKTDKNTFSCIKLQVQKESHVSDIIKAFKNEGVSFVKNKKLDKFDATIITKEYIKMKFAELNIFKDSYNDDVAYLEIPEHINWQQLKETEKIIKNTYSYKDFKTSIVSIYQENRYREFISLYIKGGCDCDRLSEIRNNFIKQIF